MGASPEGCLRRGPPELSRHLSPIPLQTLDHLLSFVELTDSVPQKTGLSNQIMWPCPNSRQDVASIGLKHRNALARQIGHCQFTPRFGRWCIRIGRRRIEDVVHPFLRPCATVAGRGWRLVHTAACAIRAAQPDMKMIVMSPPRPDLAQPCAIPFLIVAHA